MVNKIPNLFIVGVPRAGTTSIAEYLKQHPQIFMPNIKHPGYFDDYINPAFPMYFENKKNYLSLYAEAKTQKYLGDATHLFHSIKAPLKIKKFNPISKIIIILRKPSEVVSSFYESGSLNHSIPVEDALKEKNQMTFLLDENLKYFRNTKKWIDVFGKNNVHIIVYEDLKKDTKKEFSKICKFLGIRDISNEINFTPHNRARELKNKWLTTIIKKSPISWRLFIKRFLNPSQLVNFRNFIEKVTTKKIIKHELSKKLEQEINSKYSNELNKVSKLIKRDLTGWDR